MNHTSLGRAGLSSLYDQPKAQTTPNKGSRITQGVAKKNYLADDSDDDDDDGSNTEEERYSIDPSVQLFKSIDFGRNKGQINNQSSSFNNNSFHNAKKDSAAFKSIHSTPERNGNASNQAIHESQEGALVLGKASKGNCDEVQLSIDLSDSMSKNERDSLIDALEKMRKQNESLQLQVQKTKLESKQQLDEERTQRLNAVTRMQAENEKLVSDLMTAQSEAETALNLEKDKLRSALRNMEAEKNDLMNRIKGTEETAREEYFKLQYMQAEQQRKISLLEGEKSDLLTKIQLNDAELKLSTAQNSAQLAQERELLMKRMKEMEAEKNTTILQLQQSESQTKILSEQTAQQLEIEKNELRLSLERMEAEKVALSTSLARKEREVAAHAAAVENQLTQDQQDLTEAIDRIESNKELLLLAQESPSASVTSEIQQARLEMQKQLEHMIAEKEELSRKLKATQDAAEEKMRLEKEKQEAEKKELKEAVAKMKADMESERQLVAQTQKVRGSDDDIQGANAFSPRLVPDGSSLFGLMENDTVSTAASPNHMNLSSKSVHSSSSSPTRHHFINSIPEGNETTEGETFMNVDDDDDADIGEKGPGSPGQADGARSAFSDLPAPHEAAALGDLNRLQILQTLEPSLLCSVDAASRSPLFYAAAYGHTDVAKYLAGVSPIMITSPDAHGDTPLHAAASANRTETLHLLLTIMAEYTNRTYVSFEFYLLLL
jgi:ankyrin repeat protein